ncbi:Dpy-30 motif containing protein [Novymonas esmeraldas]|uniref:Dpy-30 motif containing protein n=1 Tax=Novymonas esmeraldas TaxID=1808958 RepID=A0AAW0F1P7_9TRYP
MFRGSVTEDVAGDAVDEETLLVLLQHLADAPTPDVSGGPAAALDGTAAAAFPTTTAAPAPPEDDIPEYALPDAQYIERTILPLLLRGLEEVVRIRPPDPLAFLGAYMVCNNPQRPPETSAAATSADGGSGRDAPAWLSEPADGGSAVPVLTEVVQQALSRFSGQKSGSSTGKPAVTVPKAAA